MCPRPCQRSKHRTPCALYFIVCTVLCCHPPGFFPRTSAYSSRSDCLRWRRSAFSLDNKDNMESLLREKKKNKETCVKILFVLLMYSFPCLFVCLMGYRELHTGHFRHLIIATTRNYRNTSSLHYYYFIIYLFRQEISKFFELFLNCSSSHLSPDSMENIQVYTTFHYKHIQLRWSPWLLALWSPCYFVEKKKVLSPLCMNCLMYYWIQQRKEFNWVLYEQGFVNFCMTVKQ